MLAAGAPVSAHWVADRQSGPAAPALRHRGAAPALPAPDRARRARLRHRHERARLGLGPGLDPHPRRERVEGGYKVNGTKVWTSNAHISEYMIALFRTKVVPDKKHEGLSQFLVDTKTPGDQHPAHRRPLGRAPLQRGGLPGRLRARGHAGRARRARAGSRSPPSWPSSGAGRSATSRRCRLIIETIREVGEEPGERAAVTIGRLVAHLATLRQMSLSVAGMLQAGQNPNLEAAVVKDVGTCSSRRFPRRSTRSSAWSRGSARAATSSARSASSCEHAPSFSLRGGTREVLRGIIARGLGLR